MTDINFLNSYFTNLLGRLRAEGESFRDLCLVRTESELLGDIKNLPANIYLMAVLIPSSDTKAQNIDNLKEQEIWLIYILEKADPKSETPASRITSITAHQRLITRVKKLIRDDMYNRVIPCNIRPDLNSMHTDPEHLFMGCDGYSLSFKVESDDLLTTQI